MKITKTADQSFIMDSNRIKANSGCRICPCCGESKSHIDYLKKGVLNKGVSSGLHKTWAEGVFRMRNMKVDCYQCHSCGAEWESEPYQWT